jgi:hypothetical protein
MINEHDISRFLAGQMASDDPARAEVSGFLQRLDAVYPSASTTALEADHLAAVIQEARQVREATAISANPGVAPSKTPRLAIAALAAALIALTGGVGIAAAMNGSFSQKPAALEFVAPATSAPAAPSAEPSPADPRPSSSEADAEADHRAAAPKPRASHNPAPKPTKPKPSPKASESHDDDDDDDDDGDHETEHDDEDEDD